MTSSAKTTMTLWYALAFACLIGACIGIIEIIRHSFAAHVQICCKFPQFADYSNVVPVSQKSMEQLIRRDELAYSALTNKYSAPILVSVLDTGWALYLQRAWKTNDGYITLSSGGDPRDYEISISYSVDIPNNSDRAALNKRIATLTDKFLQDHGLDHVADIQR